MSNRLIFCDLKKELIKQSKNKDNGFVSICLNGGEFTMNYIVHASDISIEDEDIFVEAENFVFHIHIDNNFKIEKNINEIEKEYILENERFKLYITFN